MPRAAREPIELPDDDVLHRAASAFLKQPLEAGAREILSGEALVGEDLGEFEPLAWA